MGAKNVARRRNKAELASSIQQKKVTHFYFNR